MEIFGKHIFYSDADNFKALSVNEQADWIKRNTNQQNDEIINEFLSNLPENENKNCLNCGNISERISKEVATVVESIDGRANSITNSHKGQQNTKGRKRK